MKYLLPLIVVVCGLVGCDDSDEEPPFEMITFYPSIKDTNYFFRTELIHMKRYLNEPIENMFVRADKRFGLQLLGEWIGNDSIIFNRIDSNTFTVDTIRRSGKIRMWDNGPPTGTAAYALGTDSLGNIVEGSDDSLYRLPIGATGTLPISSGRPEWFKDKDTLPDGIKFIPGYAQPSGSIRVKRDTIYIYRDTCATDYNKPGEYKIQDLLEEATSLNIKATSYFNEATSAVYAGNIKRADELAALGYSTKRKADYFYNTWKKQDKYNSLGVLQVTFYKDGGRVFQMEGLREYNTHIPIISTLTNYKIHADSVSIKILK